MSSSVANAQHLQKMDLELDGSDINFLQSILPSLTNSQSLQELGVVCHASGSQGVQHRLSSQSQYSTGICAYIHMHTHTLEMYRVLFDWCMCGAIYSVSLGFFH